MTKFTLAILVGSCFLPPQRTRRLPHETIAEHVGRVVGEVAPGMLLASLSEATCFFLGGTVASSHVYPANVAFFFSIWHFNFFLEELFFSVCHAILLVKPQMLHNGFFF